MDFTEPFSGSSIWVLGEINKENRTEQDRTGQDRTGQDRTGQDRTGQDRTGQDRTEELGKDWRKQSM